MRIFKLEIVLDHCFEVVPGVTRLFLYELY